MFSDSPDKSPADSPHRPGTAISPSRRKSFHNELQMALEQDTRRSAASLSSLVTIVITITIAIAIIIVVVIVIALVLILVLVLVLVAVIIMI